MELMSSLLLCVLVALLPQTLGKLDINDSWERKYNKSYRIDKKNVHRRMLVNIDVTDKGSENSDLYTVFRDVQCRKCYTCMEQAIKAHNTYSKFMKNRPSTEDLQEDILLDQVDKRYKRDSPKTNAAKNDSAKPKTAKPKRSETPKSVFVTKYDSDGEVYAVKVKEIRDSDHNNAANASCLVYSVKKLLSCKSPESNSLLTEARGQYNETYKTKASTKNYATRTQEDIL